MVVASAVVAVVEASDAVVVVAAAVIAPAEAVAGEVGSVFGIAATRNVTKE